MRRHVCAVVLVFFVCAPPLPAQSGAQRAIVKRIDFDKRKVTVSSGGQDDEYILAEDTRLAGVTGENQKERLRGFRPGAEVLYKAEDRGGKRVLLGMMLRSQSAPPAVKIVDTKHLRPLTELGTAEYQGFTGGLYPLGKNDRPAEHEEAGLALAKQIQPLDATGKPSPDGKIVLLSLGMSNTSQSSIGFQRVLFSASGLNPRLLFVNGSQGGMTAARTQNPNDNASGTAYWTEVDVRLKKTGATAAQVQAVWIKQADAAPSEGFPAYARKLEAELTRIVQVLPVRFPNVKSAYLSSRTYGGYAKTALNPEPYAYESGFSVKWLIERQLQGDPALNFDPRKGPVKAPWLSWGPYLWANGSTPRADGFSYESGDFTEQDGTHQSPAGMTKVGGQLLQFFQNDGTSRPWFAKTQ